MNDDNQTHHVYSETRMREFGETSFMGSMKLSGRVTLFVFLGFLFSAVAVGGYFYAERMLIKAAEDVSAGARTLELVTSVEKTVWRVREDEKKLLKNISPETMAAHDSSLIAITAALDALYQRGDAARARETIATLSEGLAQYGQAIKAVVKAAIALNPADADAKDAKTSVKATSRSSGLEAALQRSAKAVEMRIHASLIDTLINVMADMRKAEKDFVISGATQDLVTIKKSYDSFTTLINQAKVPEKEKQVLINLMKVYQQTVTSYAKTRLVQKKGMARIDEVFTYISPSVENLVSFAKDKLAAAEQTKKEFDQLFRLGVPAVATGLLILLTLFGMVFMQSMAAPLRALARTASGMVEGKEAEPLPVLGNADEVGELARALANLKASLAGADHLRRDLETRRAEAAREAPVADLGATEAANEIELLKSKLITSEAAAREAAKTEREAANARREIERLETEISAMQAEVEKGEAAVIEAALLRMDLDTTKAELERKTDALMGMSINGSIEVTGAGSETAAGKASAAESALPGSISSISQQVARSSENVSHAALEAERTGTMIRGLTGAAEKITEVGILLNQINEQTDLLVVTPGRDVDQDRNGPKDSNLVVLSSGPRAPTGAEGRDDTSIGRRFDVIRSTANQATWAVRDIGDTISQVRELALEIAEVSSAEALEVTAELLEQSEHLRGMLDALIDKIQTDPESGESGEPVSTGGKSDETPA